MKFDVCFAEPVCFHSEDGNFLVVSRKAYSREEAAKLINTDKGNLLPEDDITPESLEEEWVRFGFWGEDGQGEEEANWHCVGYPGKGCLPVWIEAR